MYGDAQGIKGKSVNVALAVISGRTVWTGSAAMRSSLSQGQLSGMCPKGILGVAFFQFVTAGTVFLLAHVPLAGVWAVAVLVFAIVQLPSGIVIIPVIIYLFSVKEVLPAILWTIPLLVIALSDNVLKPLLMGKGSAVPILVIFLGTIGGFVFSGFVGLFTGAIGLSVGYNLMVRWIGEGQNWQKSLFRALGCYPETVKRIAP